MRILVSLLLALSACTTNEKNKIEPVPPPWVTCTSGDACGAIAGTMLVISAATSSYGAAERRVRSRQITGTCEVTQPQLKATEACGTVLLTITDAEGGVRRAWVQDREFEVDHLKKGPFTVVAESESLGLSSTLENVRLGARISVQLKARVAQPK